MSETYPIAANMCQSRVTLWLQEFDWGSDWACDGCYMKHSHCSRRGDCRSNQTGQFSKCHKVYKQKTKEPPLVVGDYAGGNNGCLVTSSTGMMIVIGCAIVCCVDMFLGVMNPPLPGI